MTTCLNLWEGKSALRAMALWVRIPSIVSTGELESLIFIEGLTWRPNPQPKEASFKAMKAALNAGCNFWNAGEVNHLFEE